MAYLISHENTSDEGTVWLANRSPVDSENEAHLPTA